MNFVDLESWNFDSILGGQSPGGLFLNPRSSKSTGRVSTKSDRQSVPNAPQSPVPSAMQLPRPVSPPKPVSNLTPAQPISAYPIPATPAVVSRKSTSIESAFLQSSLPFQSERSENMQKEDAGKPVTPKPAKREPAKLMFTPIVPNTTSEKPAVKFGSAFKIRASKPAPEQKCPPVSETKTVISTINTAKLSTEESVPVLKRKLEDTSMWMEKKSKVGGEKTIVENDRGKIVVPKWLEEGLMYAEGVIKELQEAKGRSRRPGGYVKQVNQSDQLEQVKQQKLCLSQLHLEAELLHCSLIDLMREYNEESLLIAHINALSIL